MMRLCFLNFIFKFLCKLSLAYACCFFVAWLAWDVLLFLILVFRKGVNGVLLIFFDNCVFISMVSLSLVFWFWVGVLCLYFEGLCTIFSFFLGNTMFYLRDTGRVFRFRGGWLVCLLVYGVGSRVVVS